MEIVYRIMLRSCPCCGLAHEMPALPVESRAVCTRCRTTLQRRSRVARSNSRTAAIAAAALILFPLAITLPLLRVERFGHVKESGILEGVATLLADGEWIVGIIVGLCSVIIPFTKLASLLVLSAGGLMLRHEHKAMTYHLVQWTGRWGMLDVLLVALLVAILKLGDMVDVSAGPGALMFTSVVVLSLLATACFDPHSLWDTDEIMQKT